ncbi:MAG: ROK family protein [Methylophilaceae bacterium]
MALEHNIGIDLGGTKIECIVLENQKEIFRDRILTESEKGSDHILNQIHQIYQKAILFIENQKHSLGICTPGSISPDTNLLRNSNTTCLNGLPFKKILEDKLDHPLSIENDANCFALAEAVMGAGQDHAFIFGVIMGTGCGGGFVHNKKLRVGPNLISGEWGHSILHTNGHTCYCQKQGCVETYISGGGLSKILNNHGIHLSVEAFFKKEDKNNIESRIYQNFMNDFAQAMGNIINSIDPDIIILGGGLSNVDSLYTDGINAINQYIFSETLKTPIVRNQLGDSAGVFGAALL